MSLCDLGGGGCWGAVGREPFLRCQTHPHPTALSACQVSASIQDLGTTALWSPITEAPGAGSCWSSVSPAWGEASRWVQSAVTTSLWGDILTTVTGMDGSSWWLKTAHTGLRAAEQGPSQPRTLSQPRRPFPANYLWPRLGHIPQPGTRTAGHTHSRPRDPAEVGGGGDG